MGVADMGGGGFGGFGAGAGMGAAMGGGGDAGGGDMGGGGGKVNMQATMAMIPKPIALPPLEGGIQPIRPSPPMPLGGGGGNQTLSEMIMQFLQG